MTSLFQVHLRGSQNPQYYSNLCLGSFFLLIHVIAVAGTMIELIFWVRLKLESRIKVQMAINGSNRTLNRRSAATPITDRITQSGIKWIRLIGQGRKAFCRL